ncbi:MAG: Uma2 family endonuclease [Fimbriimonas sp.]
MRVHEAAAAYGATLRRMTVDEFYLAAKKGVFRPDERLELLEGQVLLMSPQNASHAWITHRVAELLADLFEDGYIREHSPLAIGEFDEPEPDVLVARGPAGKYRSAHPTATDVLLVVEVADTTLAKDRSLKGRIYATAGIPEYWIVDVKSERVEVHREPLEGRFWTSQVVNMSGELSPMHGIGSVKISELFGS